MSGLRVATYNLYLGGRDRLDLIHEVLVGLDADVVGLTEADDPEVVAELARRLDVDHVWARGSGDHHIAALYRLPLADWRVHTRKPLTQAVLETRFTGPGGPLTVYTAHLLPYLLLPFEIRRWQAAGALLALIRSRPAETHLIVGDLNAVARGDQVRHRDNPARMRRIMAMQGYAVPRLAVPRLVRAGYLDCFRHLHPDDPGFTFMPRVRTTRYDYVLAPPDLAARLAACEVVRQPAAVLDASDHLPLMAEFDGR